jgi:uncharacterized protein YbjT (DUF2867 family)
MKVLIVGANGKVGTLLSGILWGYSEFSPIALIRDFAQQPKFTALGVPSLLGDLENGVSDLLPGLDAIIFTAGSGGHTGPEKTIDVDQNGAIRLMNDCQKVGLKRFIMISAIGANPKSKSPRIQHYLRAKGVADLALRNSSLDYTIIAPGTLTDEKGTGFVQVANQLGNHGNLPREDLAYCIVESLRNTNSIKSSFEIVSGRKKIKDSINDLVGVCLPPIA